MDPRTVAHVLNQIGDLLELHGQNRFKTAAYRNAARAVLGIQTDDLRPLYRSGELREFRGIGPATLSVIRELVETGESSYFEQLREDTPEGLIEMLRVPALRGQDGREDPARHRLPARDERLRPLPTRAGGGAAAARRRGAAPGGGARHDRRLGAPAARGHSRHRHRGGVPRPTRRRRVVVRP